MHVRVALLALAIAASGCIRLQSDLTINRDASGVLELRYAIGDQTIAQIKAMLALERQLASAAGLPLAEPEPGSDLLRRFFEPSEDQIRKELKKYESLGIVAEKVTVEARNAWRHLHLRVKFARLASLQQLDFFQDYGFNLVRNEKGRYVLYRQVKRPPPSPPSDVSEEDLVKLLSPVLAGFNVVVTVNTPGRIVETTAPGPSAHTATWRFDFARDPNVLLSLQRFGMQIVFDGQGLDLPTLTQSPPAGAAKAADRPNA